jgi:hypothetical protein
MTPGARRVNAECYDVGHLWILREFSLDVAAPDEARAMLSLRGAGNTAI